MKGVYYNVKWIGVMLIVMGGIFLSVALIMQLVAIRPESFSFRVNGVMQPYSEHNVQMFRLIFLASFGIPAIILLSVGGAILWRAALKKRQAQVLQETGKMIYAHHLDLGMSAIRVNYQYKFYLTCSYTNPQNETFIFRSRLLRYDPRPYLEVPGTVKVYYDEMNIKRYFVDVEGSMRTVYEL